MKTIFLIFTLLLSLFVCVFPVFSAPSPIISPTKCPVHFDYVPRIPWNGSECKNNHSRNNPSNSSTGRSCCQALLSLFGIALSNYLKEFSHFNLPDLPTSISCLQDFQTKLNSVSLPSNLTTACFDPMQFVTTPNKCASIQTTQDWTKKLGNSTVLDSACKPDLTDLTSCDACVAAGFRVQGDLIAIDGNKSHSTDCFYFAVLYAAGFVNQFGPESIGAVSCIFGLSIGTDRSNRSERRTPSSCQGDGFLKYSGIKLPDSQNSSYNEQSMSLANCKAECSRNCSCMAYTQLNISGAGSGCQFYHGDLILIDIKTLAQVGQDLHIRMASAEIDSKGKKRVILIVSLASVAGTIFICLCLILFCTQKTKKNQNRRKEGPFSKSRGKEAELPFFSLSTILKATDHFSKNNRLGEGGFGPVYKGMLEDGQEIAVKRLSETSSQGVDELKNEVILIAKLQHRNLVRLLGCGIEREENMLIYEFMPNGSLDLILFDQTKSMLLDWRKRFHIINGIAKGLLYLHQDSRLRIIHRDLKASNILLDADMNPKISDFGLARSFGGNETEAQTRRVIGTYGYMSPEYAIHGMFSVKSDVFSFGVLILEVVSGKRNRGFSLQDHNLNLLGHAWTLYKEDNSHKLVDAALGNSLDLSQVLRSIHVGLLCVQKRPEDRPSMSSVVFMLGNEVELPQAKPPGFFSESDIFTAQSSNRTTAACSFNQVTITLPEGR